MQGNTHLYLNTYLDKGGALQEQKTDRLLVHGDVEGTTTVHVRDAFGSRGGYTGERGNSKGISIIQVYGITNKDSFQLNGGYVTSQGSPYQYSLHAYGPSSSLGGANLSQRVLKSEGEFGDFRLESEVIQPTSSDTTNLFLIRHLPVSGRTPLTIFPLLFRICFLRLSEMRILSLNLGKVLKTQAFLLFFLSKLYLLRSFGDKQLVSFKKDFQLGAFGSSLEVGLGFNTRLSTKFALHGNVIYQHRLTKAGFSGMSFSGRLQYHF